MNKLVKDDGSLEGKRRIRFPRRREELPHPELGPGNEKNKLHKVFAVRIEPDLLEEFNKYVREHDMTKRAALEEALKRYMKSPKPTA